MTWTWTVTSSAGRVSGTFADYGAAADWVELILAHCRGEAVAEVAGPNLPPLRIATRGGYLYLPDERPAARHPEARDA